MKRYIFSHLPVAIGYALFIVLIRGGYSFSQNYLLNQIWWVAGVVMGVLIIFLDRITYTYNFPSEQLSQQFTWYWKQKNYLTALNLLDVRRHEQQKLTFRSAIFMAVWVPLSFFALTSTSALFGKGVVMGLMLHLLADAWREQRINPEGLKVRLFWQIKREITREEQLGFMYTISFLFVIFSLWAR